MARTIWGNRPNTFQVALAFSFGGLFLLAGMGQFWGVVLTLTAIAWLTNSILDWQKS